MTSSNPPDAGTPEVAPDVEVTRYIYNGKGHQIARLSQMRVARSTASDDARLSPGKNAVETIDLMWYDAAGKMVASARYGAGTHTLPTSDPLFHRLATKTGSSLLARLGATANQPIHGEAAQIRPLKLNAVSAGQPRLGYDIQGQVPPPSSQDAFVALSIPSAHQHSIVTRYGYDEAGRQVIVINPNGTVTETMYTSLGDVASVVEWSDHGSSRQALRVTAYGYDSTGRLTHIASLPGKSPLSVQPSVTSLQYVRGLLNLGSGTCWGAYDDVDAGQSSAQPGLKRWTPRPIADAKDYQVTEIVYGAEVVNPAGGSFTGTSTTYGPDSRPNFHNGWIGQIRFPNPQTGLPDTQLTDTANALTFKYLIGGELLERRDGRGIGIRHAYDGLGRRTRTWVTGPNGHSFTTAQTMSSQLDHPQGAMPLDMIAEMTFEYDQLGRLTNARSFSLPEGSPTAGSTLVSRVEHAYDRWGNLTTDRQHFGGTNTVAAAALPVMDVNYAWDTIAAVIPPGTEDPSVLHTFNRLASIQYPDRVHGTAEARRRIHLNYGSGSTTPDDKLSNGLSRIVGYLDDPSGSGAASTLRWIAKFAYAGESTRVRTDYAQAGTTFRVRAGDGADVTQTTVGTSQVWTAKINDLDSFARLRDLTWSLTAPTESAVRRQRLGYDRSGNILTSLVDRRIGTTEPLVSDHSWFFNYDGLHRLIKADMGSPTAADPTLLLAGQMATGLPMDSAVFSPASMTYRWSLDALGNWTGTTGSGWNQFSGLRAEGDLFNDGTNVLLDRVHGVTAFNAIRSITTQTQFGTSQPQPAQETTAIRDAAGNLLADDRYIYLYDAFNRLVLVRQRGNATIQTTGPPGLVTAQSQWSSLPQNPVVLLQLVHDAHNRVIRTQRALASWSDPAEAPIGTPSTIPTVRIERHAYDGQRRIATVRVDEQTIDDQGQSSISKDRRAPTTTTQIVATAFEYVWGPGDGLGGVDELVTVLADHWQYTPLLDHMGSVTGWTRTNLHPGPNLGQTQTLEHRVFDPYGQIIRRSGPLGPDIPVGHQGLFHERLDYADNPSASPRVFEPWARHLVLNRSRVYLPSHGRFAQQDPNATGATPVTSVGFHGEAPWPTVQGIQVAETFADGLSVFAYIRSSPLSGSDPTGLMYVGFVSLVAPSPMDFITGAYRGLIEEYAQRLNYDVEWAIDWEAEDHWHTRGESKWITWAMARGVKDAFGIGLPGLSAETGEWSPFEYNLADHILEGPEYFGIQSGAVPGGRFPRAVRKLYSGMGPIHHIATIYGANGVRFQKLLKRAGVQLNDAINGIPVPNHRGPHAQRYHDEVYNRLNNSIRGLPKAQRQAAFLSEMVRIRKDIGSGVLKLND